MAYQQSEAVKITLVANADLSLAQGKFVKLLASGKCDLVTATTDRVIGVLDNKPKLGQEAAIVVLGTTKMVASATLALGDSLATAVDGRAATALTTAGLSNLGTVLIANTVANGWVTVLVNCVNQTR